MENNDEVICSICKEPGSGGTDLLHSHSWVCQKCSESLASLKNSEQTAFEKSPNISTAVINDSSTDLLECSIPNCSYIGDPDEFLIHLMQKHETDLLTVFDHTQLPGPQEELRMVSETKDPITKRINLAGREAKLGATGKFYCQGKLNGPCLAESAECCGGYCGPTYGCNCRACQVLDIEAKGLPKEYWVNAFGAICVRETNNKIFCGRPMSFRVKKTHCGTTSESQCYSCRALEFQLGDRYAGLNEP